LKEDLESRGEKEDGNGHGGQDFELPVPVLVMLVWGPVRYPEGEQADDVARGVQKGVVPVGQEAQGGRERPDKELDGGHQKIQPERDPEDSSDLPPSPNEGSSHAPASSVEERNA
jgi:hypothetical protein